MSPRQAGVARRQWMLQAMALAAGALPGSQAMAAASKAEAEKKVWRLAVVPQLTAIEMARNWTPVVAALAQAGVACELVVYPSIAKFEPEFSTGRADFVYLNPYHMVMAQHAHGYQALLRDSRPLEGVVVVKNEGPVKAMEQLKDHRLSFPAPNAFAASLYIRSVLERQYHLVYDAHYAGTHRNAIRQVLSGDSAAAGVVRTTLEQEPAEVRQALRVLYTTPPLSPHPLAAHPRVPADIRRKLAETLMQLAASPDTKALMAAIQMPNPQLANYRADYAPLDLLKIEKFIVVE